MISVSISKSSEKVLSRTACNSRVVNGGVRFPTINFFIKELLRWPKKQLCLKTQVY